MSNRKTVALYRELTEGLGAVLLGNLAGYGGQFAVTATIAGVVVVIASNYYHALAGRWVAAFVGVGASSLLFLLGIFI